MSTHMVHSAGPGAPQHSDARMMARRPCTARQSDRLHPLPHLRLLAMVCLLLGPLLVACAPASGPTSTSTGPVVSGRVTGHVYATGGFGARTPPTAPTPVETVVTATPIGGGQARSTMSASDGSYVIDLPVGAYDVAIVPPGQRPEADGTPTYGPPKTATVVAGASVTVDFYLNAP